MFESAKAMSKGKPISEAVSRRVVAKGIRAIGRWLDDLHTPRTVKLMQPVGVADDKVHGESLRGYCAALQEELDSSEIHAGKSNRFPLGKSQPEAQPVGIERDRLLDIVHREHGVAHLAIDFSWTDRIRVKWFHETRLA